MAEQKKLEEAPEIRTTKTIGASELWAPSPNRNPHYDSDRRGRRHRAWGGNPEDGTYWEE